MSGQEVFFDEFRDMVLELTAAGVEYLIVGGHAVAAHGVVRATLDIDIFVRSNPENASRVMQALRAWGAPVETHGISEADFSNPGTVYQLGLPPRRIDLLTKIDGVTFDEACEGKLVVRLGDVEFPVIGREALIRNKLASGRHKDLGDVEALGSKTTDG